MVGADETTELWQTLMRQILTGFKDIVSDTVFNAVGTITARKIADKVCLIFGRVLAKIFLD